MVQFGGAMFRTVPLPIDMWLKIIAVGFGVVVLQEVIKTVKRAAAAIGARRTAGEKRFPGNRAGRSLWIWWGLISTPITERDRQIPVGLFSFRGRTDARLEFFGSVDADGYKHGAKICEQTQHGENKRRMPPDRQEIGNIQQKPLPVDRQSGQQRNDGIQANHDRDRGHHHHCGR